MIAVLRRELRSLFSSVWTWATVAVMLLFTVLFTGVYNLLYGSALFAYPVSAMRPVLCACIPILAASVVTRERQKGTESFLFSLPLRTSDILFGKYLAVLGVCLIPILGLSVLPLILGAFGPVDLGVAYEAILGLLLFACAFSALCVFLASLVKRTWIAWILGWGAGVLLYLLSAWVLPLAEIPVLGELLAWLNLYASVASLCSGFLDLVSLLRLLTFTAFFLTLFGLAIRKPMRFPKERRTLLSVAVGAGALAILLVCNLFPGLLPFRARNVRVAQDETFSVSGATQDYLDTLSQDVTLYWFVDGGEKNADKDLYTYLLSYGDASPHLHVQVLDPVKDAAEFAKKHSAVTPEANMLIVEGPERYRQLTVNEMIYYRNDMLGLELSYAEYQLSLLAFQTGSTESTYYSYGQYLTAYAAYTKAYFDGNAILSRAVEFVTQEEIPYVGIWAKKDAASIPETSFLAMMERYSYGVRGVSDLADIPTECDLLILYAPTADLTEGEAEGLRTYLAQGGKLLLATAPGGANHPRLLSVLAEYGLSTKEGLHILAEDDSDYFVWGEGFAYPYYIWAHQKSHAITAQLDSKFLILSGHALQMTETAGVTHTSLLYTSEKGYLVEYPDKNSGGEPSNERLTYSAGVLAEKGDSAIVWISSAGALSDYANVQSEGGNYAWLHHCMDYLMGISTEELPIPASLMSTQALTVTVGGLTIFCVIGILISLLPLIVGIARRYIRKKRSRA